MKHLKHTLCGALMILPAMLWAQEDVEKTNDQEIVIEWTTDGEFPEGMNEKIRAIIDKEMMNVSDETDGVKLIMIEDDIELDGDAEMRSESVKIISQEDEDGNTVLKKYVNGKEVRIEEGEDMFLMDLESFEGQFPETMHNIETLLEMVEGNQIDRKELQEKLSKMEMELDAQNKFHKDVNIIKEIDENGVEKVRTFVNGEEVDGTDFPVIDLDFSDNEFVKDGDVKVIMICQEIFVDTITDEDDAPKNLKISKKPLELEELSMFPNPNNGVFTLKLQGESDAKVNVRVLNVEGKTIYNQKLKPSGGLCTQEIDISKEGKGMYFLNIEQKGKYLSRKIVVQ